jgi:hypothetical protein
MADAKRKPKLQASEVEVGKRTLEGVLIDLAEQIKANDARFAKRSARAEARIAQLEEQSTIALQTIAAVSQDLRAFTQEIRTLNMRTESRLDPLEKPAGA